MDHQSLDILSNQIKFQIDLAANLKTMEIGVFIGIGYNCNRKSIVLRIHHRQAHSIYGY